LKFGQVAVGKRSTFVPRRKLFVRQAALQEMAVQLLTNPKWKETFAWMITAYVFLLRVP